MLLSVKYTDYSVIVYFNAWKPNPRVQFTTCRETDGRMFGHVFVNGMGFHWIDNRFVAGFLSQYGTVTPEWE